MAESKVNIRVLIISHDKIGSAMAGPGIRYHYMGQVLSDKFEVTVAFFSPNYLPEEGFSRSYNTAHIDAYSFESAFSGFDVVIARWLSDAMINFCNQNNIFAVFDLYVPGPVETLASSIYSGQEIKPEDEYSYNKSLEMDRKFFENGDLFLFSNQRQLDFWTGYAFGGGAVSLSSYSYRPIYDRFIYAPMGIDTSKKVKHTKDVLKGIVPGIKKDDKALIWTGGIWNHFDGKILIRAMKLLEKNRPDIKLFFLGTQHPNPDVPEMRESFDTKNLAQELGLINSNVFFNDGWVRYGERLNYLLEADIAVNTHKPSIETEFSHRTRVLDHFLAEVPTISSSGDFLSDEVIKPLGLGEVVQPDDDKALREAIVGLLEPDRNKVVRQNIARLRNDFDWQSTMSELKSILLTKPAKLKTPAKPVNSISQSRTRRIAKRVLPKSAKKAIIRSLRLK